MSYVKRGNPYCWRGIPYIKKWRIKNEEFITLYLTPQIFTHFYSVFQNSVVNLSSEIRKSQWITPQSVSLLFPRHSKWNSGFQDLGFPFGGIFVECRFGRILFRMGRSSFVFCSLVVGQMPWCHSLDKGIGGVWW